MKIKYLYPYWGSEHLSIKKVLSTIAANGFDGIEVNISPAEAVRNSLHLLRKESLTVVAQMVMSNQVETPEAFLHRALDKLDDIRQFQPDLINCHTGKDHFSFEANCMIIEGLEAWSTKNAIPIHHEIHRGRFSFHSTTLLPYLDTFPELKLVADFSHWCTVSESLLEDQAHVIGRVIPHVYHIHARVGWSQAAQVTNPFSKDAQLELASHLHWWQKIIDFHKVTTQTVYITPEQGPYPYNPDRSNTEKAAADQKWVNLSMKRYLEENLTL